MNPVLVSTWGQPKKYFRSFLMSAELNDIDPQNADPDDWPGADWTEIPWHKKSEAQARFVRENVDKFSHFMFTDSYDIVFAAGWDEILRKFEALNSPIVFGAECYCWPPSIKASRYPETPHRCKYINAGMWIARADVALQFTTDLAARAAQRVLCDQGNVAEMFLSKQYPMVLDTTCSLLFCCNMDSLSHLDLSGVRPKTKDTGEEPVVFHGNGASRLDDIINCLGV